MTQGERVKAVRKTLNLSMEKFGERIGIGKAAVSLIENGKNNLTEANAKAICREFNIDYLWLIEGVGNMFLAAPEGLIDELANEHNLKPLEAQLLRHYLAMNESDRDVFTKFVQRFVMQKDE